MIEQALESDIKTLVEMKLEMFRESGHSSLLAADSFTLICNYYENLYKSGTARHFIFKNNSKVIAYAGGFIKSDIPYCFMKTPFYGFIGDVYTIPTERNKGCASLLTNAVIDWLKIKGVSEIRLLASAEARHIYEKIGFCKTDEMILSV